MIELGRDMPLDALSQRVEAMRTWWAFFVHDGITLTPEVVALITGQLAALRSMAEEYEDVLSTVNALLIAGRASELHTALGKRGAIEAALARKGLRATVVPASSLLTDAQRADPKIAVLDGRRRASAGPEAAS